MFEIISVIDFTKIIHVLYHHQDISSHL